MPNRATPRADVCAGALMLQMALVSWAPLTEAEDRGRVAVSYQYIHTDGFAGTGGRFDIGTTDAHSLNVELERTLGRRIAVSAGIPLIMERYQGGAPHVPANLDPPSDDEFIDDGDYHTSFQDFHLGVHWLASTSALVVEPFLYLGMPSQDYAYFGQSAVGQNLWRVEVGSSFAYQPPLSDFYYRVSPSYTFVEKR